MDPNCPRGEHLGRRTLLKASLATATGGAIMNWGHLFGTQALAAEVKKRQKRCILIWLNGGASQFETFDMKVGRPTGGPFRPISTNVAGVQVCELMPKIAQMMDKVTVVRSMKTSQIDHPQGIHLMHTAYSEASGVRFPEMGAVIAKYIGQEDSDLPSFIKISSNGNSGAGFLGPKYMPFNLDGTGKLSSFASSEMKSEVELRRHNLRKFVDDSYIQDHRAETLRMHKESYDASRRLMNARAVFKTDDEWEKNKALYGDSHIGRRCMVARKLVENGVPFVEVGHSGYDTHADNFIGHKGLVPPMDHAWAGLITDLDQRGLLDDTLIVWMGEIGRTPSINNRAGRDHYVRAWSTALVGGGIKRGLVYGSTDEDGKDVKDNPVTEGDFFATIYKSLGINPEAENFAGSRPIPLAPFGSKVVKDLLV